MGGARSAAVALGVIGLLLGSFLVFPLAAYGQPAGLPHSHPIVGRHDHGRNALTMEQTTSENWAGYVVTGTVGSVTDVQGSWIIPSLTCSGSGTQYVAFWDGIDGFSSDTVEQTGIIGECHLGTPSYYAWYEFYPNPSYEIGSITPSPGNTISATVSASGDTFTTTLTDVSTSQTYTTEATVSSAQADSAEWITEAPSSSSGILPLADYGQANYGYDYTGVASTGYATIGGVTGAIGSFPSSSQYELSMVSSSGTTITTPSSLTTDGTSFTDVYGSGTTTTTTSSTTSTTSSSSSSSSTTTTTTTANALTLKVSLPGGTTYRRGSYVEIALTVTSSGKAVGGAYVTATLTLPNGETASGSLYTGSNGQGEFYYVPNLTGTYSLSVTASKSGYTPASATASFAVV